MNTRTGAAAVTALIVLLILAIPVNMNYVSPLLAQSGETDEDDTSSASQDYQEFQSCLSDAEADGTVSEQQIRDCFAPIYNTGTGTGTGTSTGSPPSDEDSSDGDDTGSDDEEDSSEGAE